MRAASVALAVARLLSDPAMREEMARNSRRRALEEFPLERQACRYLELYKGLLGGIERSPARCPGGALA